MLWKRTIFACALLLTLPNEASTVGKNKGKQRMDEGPSEPYQEWNEHQWNARQDHLQQPQNPHWYLTSQPNPGLPLNTQEPTYELPPLPESLPNQYGYQQQAHLSHDLQQAQPPYGYFGLQPNPGPYQEWNVLQNSGYQQQAHLPHVLQQPQPPYEHFGVQNHPEANPQYQQLDVNQGDFVTAQHLPNNPANDEPFITGGSHSNHGLQQEGIRSDQIASDLLHSLTKNQTNSIWYPPPQHNQAELHGEPVPNPGQTKSTKRKSRSRRNQNIASPSQHHVKKP